MNGFLACGVLKLFIIIISKLLEAETKVQLTYIVYLKTSVFSFITLCYYSICIYFLEPPVFIARGVQSGFVNCFLVR